MSLATSRLFAMTAKSALEAFKSSDAVYRNQIMMRQLSFKLSAWKFDESTHQIHQHRNQIRAAHNHKIHYSILQYKAQQLATRTRAAPSSEPTRADDARLNRPNNREDQDESIDDEFHEEKDDEASRAR